MRNRWERAPISVVCPACATGRLEVRFSCLRSDVVCRECLAVFLLADLVDKLDEHDFETLALALEYRLCDRV